MADISKIKLPNGTTYNIKDNNALPLTGGSVTGPVSFGDSISIDEATVGDLVVNGSASFTNNIQANTINGVAVGSSPKFTDTTYSSLAAASGGTAVSLVTTGEKYIWNSKTSNTGTITSVKTTAGTHTTINVSSGAVSFNVPTKTSHLTNDSGFIVKNSDNSIYTNIAHAYIGSTTGKPYWKIIIPNIATRWTIITLYFNIQENYATGAGGKLIVNGYHGSTSPYTWSGLTFSTIGFLSHSIQVYASGGDTFYIGGLTSGYFNIDLEKVLVADSARSVDISGTTIERVAELPSEYSTASFRQNQYVGDAGNGTATTFAYSKTGLDSTSWLAAWNGYELRAISPSKITAGSVAWSNVSSKPTATGSKATGITASTTATKTTLGTASSIYGVKSGTNSTTTASKASGSNGSASTWAFEEVSIPNVTATGSASSWTFEDIACDDITSWSAGSGSASISGEVDPNDSTQMNITISHTHTAPTLQYTARTVSSKKSGANSTAPTLGTAIKVQSKKSGSNGTAPSWSFTDVTVPIRSDSATSVPNVSVASATVTITDNGHTHSI